MAPEYGTIGAAERSYPEERPLIGAAAYARDTLTLLNERRRTILFVLAAALLFLGIVIAAQVHGDAIADSMNGRVMQGCDHAPDCGEALCASQYSNYTMIGVEWTAVASGRAELSHELSNLARDALHGRYGNVPMAAQYDRRGLL